jgi:hypothetical protein
VITMPATVISVSRLCRWVVVMTLAVGVVVMHHVVGAHGHPGGSGNAPAGMTMPGTQAEGCCGVAPVAVVVLARPAQPDPDGGLMLHPCLAVLTGLVLLAGLILTWRLAHAPEPGPSGAGLDQGASRQRASPIPLRLAQLGVLRL